MTGRGAVARELGFEDWPPADRAMWQGLVAEGSLFEEGGAFAGIRPASLKIYRDGYATWLGWLDSRGLNIGSAAEPLERVTPELIARYVGDQSELSPRTVHNRLSALLRVVGAAYPSEDLAVLRRSVRFSRRKADRFDRERPRPEQPAAGAILPVARRLIAKPPAAAMTDLHRAIARRDAVMFMLLFRHPLRVSSFAALRLGTSYRVMNRGHFILVAPENAKEGEEIPFRVDPEVAEAVSVYLAEARPRLLGRAGDTDALWVSQRGGTLAPHSLRMRVRGLAQAHIGICLTPHDFRDIGVTAMARAGTTDAESRRGLLAHSDRATTDRFYNHATAGEALGNYGTLIERLTRKGASS